MLEQGTRNVLMLRVINRLILLGVKLPSFVGVSRVSANEMFASSPLSRQLF